MCLGPGWGGLVGYIHDSGYSMRAPPFQAKELESKAKTSSAPGKSRSMGVRGIQREGRTWAQI